MNRLAPQLALLALLTPLASAGEHAGLFNRLDANRDGRLVAAEVPKEQLSLFKRLVRTADKNRDGWLTLREFETGLTPTRPAKPLTEKVENKLLGSDALLLVLAWMDINADLVVTSEEVTPEMRPLFDEFVDFLNLKDQSRIPIPQLSQQAIQFASRAARFVARERIDVKAEMALLSEQQVAYVERLRHSLRGRAEMMANPEGAAAFFDQLDTDGDGNVTASEVPEPYADRFAALLTRADRDQDNQLSEQEFKKFSARYGAFEANRPSVAETTQRSRQLIRRSDRDGDGLLTRQETPPRMAQRFAKLDQNGDGQLDQTEIARGVEILESLRKSAVVQPTSTPAKSLRSKNPAQN
jgi:Ca2+-binding EF-hand superfamily protein